MDGSFSRRVLDLCVFSCQRVGQSVFIRYILAPLPCRNRVCATKMTVWFGGVMIKILVPVLRDRDDLVRRGQ